jgi:hypothetical protein
MCAGIQYVNECQFKSGIHNKAAIGASNGSDVGLVAAYVAGLHLKHIRFAVIAHQTRPDIDIRKSLTIWGLLSDIVSSASDFLDMPLERVRSALAVLTVKPHEGSLFVNRTTPLIPLLIDMGNGHVLRPASCVTRNVLDTVIPIARHRDPNGYKNIIQPREDWLRSQLYAAFHGSRLATVNGNTKLNENGRTVTDVDAAILDVTCGEMAIFQLKWQDYSTNDVKELRSKAANFVTEVEEWARRVNSWIASRSIADVMSAFRLNVRKHGMPIRIFLFAISRHVCRTQGYGYINNNEYLGTATLSQFLRVRYEVGPVPFVFDKIHEQLVDEHPQNMQVKPLPYDLKVSSASVIVHYHDYFVAFGDSVSEAA